MLQNAQRPPRWPMYVRQLKQYIRAVDPTFDERKFGFETLGDLMRACQREGLLRIERDRQGGMRIFPGNLAPVSPAEIPAVDEAEAMPAAEAGESVDTFDSGWTPQAEPAGAQDVVDGDVVQEIEVPAVVDGEEAPSEPETPAAAKPSRRRPRAAKGRAAGEPRTSRKTADAPAKARKTATRSRAARGRGRTETSNE